MATVKGRGQLLHHFHGNYWAAIALDFGSPEAARDALKQLQGWKIGEKHPQCLIWSGDSEALGVQKALLGSFGADVRKIDSLKYSVDCGEPFEVVIPVTPAEQLALF